MELEKFWATVAQGKGAEHVIHHSLGDSWFNQCRFVVSLKEVSLVFSQYDTLECDDLHFEEETFHAAVAKVLHILKDKGMRITMQLERTSHHQCLPAKNEDNLIGELWESFATGKFRQLIPSVAHPSDDFQKAVIELSLFLGYNDAITLLNNVSESNALVLVQDLPSAIEYIDKPSTKTSIKAIEGMLSLDPDSIPDLLEKIGPDIAPEVVVAAISEEYHALHYLEQMYGEYFLNDFPEALQRKAIEADVMAITNIKNPPYALLSLAISRCPGVIGNFEDVSPELEYQALTHGQKKGAVNVELLIDVWHGHQFSKQALDCIQPGLGNEYQRLRALDVNSSLAMKHIEQFITKKSKQQQWNIVMPSDF